MQHERVLVLDFGGQYNQLIARRVRDLNVYCDLKPCDMTVEEIRSYDPIGIIFTGGPNSVYDPASPHVPEAIFSLGIPVLGICYGCQLIAYTLGGKVEHAPTSEYGKREVRFGKASPLSVGVPERSICWMSHTDHVTEVPAGFEVLATTESCPAAVFGCAEKNIYGIQFHPEVVHSEYGNLLLKKLRAWMAKNGLKRNIKLVFFAYNYSVYAPVCRKNGRIIPAVKADKDLIVRIAPIGANCYYPIDSDMHFYPYKRIIDEWRAVCDKIMLWTYHTNYKCYLWFFPTMQHWAEDLRYFKESGTEFLFMQSDHTEAVDWKADMETYVASKMLWDCSSDPYALRREYIDLMFGAAAEYVVKIIDIFEKNYARIAENSQKLRHEFNLALFGKDPEFPFETSSEKVAEVLRKEADAEWTKNVYFSIYHLEITWAKVQPKELLKEQMRLLTEAKGAVCGDIGADRIITALEKIELSLRFMTAYNYNEYYGEEGRDEYIA